jgi:hypothetical protein
MSTEDARMNRDSERPSPAGPPPPAAGRSGHISVYPYPHIYGSYSLRVCHSRGALIPNSLSSNRALSRAAALVVANTPGLVVYLERSHSCCLPVSLPHLALPPSPPCYIHLYISLSLFANHPLTLVVFALVVQGMLSDTRVICVTIRLSYNRGCTIA